MFIRGVDFARHNIVVGMEAENPIATNTPAFQPRGELVARVLAVSGAEATLEVGDQRMVVQTHMALNAGDKLMVRVFEGPGGNLRFSVLASGPENGAMPLVPDSEVDQLLRALGIPADERSRNVARALLARDGTLDKPAFTKLTADLRPFPQVTPREAGTAALLQKAGVPVTPATLQAVVARAEPHAPPQLAARLLPLADALKGLRSRLPASSRATSTIDEILRVLTGLPLDEKASPTQVESQLRAWVERLTPREAQPRPAAPTPPKVEPQAGPQAQPTPEGEEATVHKSLSPPPAAAAPLPEAPEGQTKNLARLAVPEALTEVPDEANDQAAPKAPPPAEENAAPRSPAEAGKQPLERPSRVPPSQHFAGRLGITSTVPEPGKADLASMLEKLAQDLGTDHKDVRNLVKEASAEVRYTQLVNSAPQDRADRPILVPLLVPQLSQEQPEGRLQVFHKAGKKGEPIDPENVRLVFVLGTDHLGEVQADVSIKDGVVDLVVGVGESEDREFLAKHLDELEGAIAKLGWTTGRFGTRVAKGPPPKISQEEGLTEIVRFDRRV